MDKGIITLSVSKNATDEEIKALRDMYKRDNYVVNIVKSGHKDNKEWLAEFINARLNA